MLGLFGVAAFFLAGLVVSIRLLRLWSRERGLPELSAALGLLGIGPLGFCVLTLGLALFHDTAAARPVAYGALAIQNLGFLSTAIFTWRVFHAGAAAVRTAVLAIGALLAADWLAVVAIPVPRGTLGAHHHAGLWLKIGILVWGGGEALRSARIVRARVRLGLGDPLVAASFRLWGLAQQVGALGFAGMYALLALAPQHVVTLPAQAFFSTCGLLSALFLYVAFLPPRRWARWLSARAAAPEHAG